MYPLSLPQQSIYLDALRHGATTKHNMGGALIISGPLDIGRFRQSLECARHVHDVQRMRLHWEGETVRQEFLAAEDCPSAFEYFDFSSRLQPYPDALEWILEDIGRPMRLNGFPLYRDVLFCLGKDLHLWFPKFHHISNDAFGHSLIAGTVAAAYTELLRNRPCPAFKSFSYLDFIEDDRAYASSGQFGRDEAFWREKFRAMPEPLPFTSRKGGLRGDILRTERCTLELNRLVYRSVLRRCEEADVTPFQFLLACLFTYLYRVTGCDDMVIGTPILNRSNHAFRRTAGMFMNMMPIRLRLDRTMSLLALAEVIKGETRACYRHQRFPLREILQWCRTLDGFFHGVYDVTFVYRKLDYDLSFGDSPLRVVTLDTQAREETLSVEVDEYNQEEDVNLFFNYNAQLISATEAGQMAKAIESMLVTVAVEGDRRIQDIRLVADTVIHAAVPREKIPEQTVVELFQRRAAADPKAVCLICGPERMTRGELDLVSDRIAEFLSETCALAAEQPVAVLCDRSMEWIAAMLGILKAGGAYVPLDPGIPRSRMQFLLRDSGCRWLLTGARQQEESFADVRAIPVAKACLGAGLRSGTAIRSPRSLAYILYTSGTTGEPKGVLVEHGGLANTVAALQRGWEVTAGDRILEFAGPMFDASIVDIFLALVSGAPLVIAPQEIILHPERFLLLLQQEKVTVATLPPAYLSALGEVDLMPLRLLITAGEAANPVDAAYHVRRVDYVNAYGPTEASVCAAYFKVKAGSGFRAERVPIGKPIDHTLIRILDEDLQPLPLGAAGELCIGGVGLARGYLNRPELTADRFIADPFLEGGRLYRTGDLGRLLPDGNLEFLGRRDTQVKIRGYRVELGEIEAVLKMHPAVETAVVVDRKIAGFDELVAYVVSRAGFQPAELRRFLSARLPAFMLPSRWQRMEALPLNLSGKVDRAALPDPMQAEEFRTGSARTRIEPRTAMEKALVEIWEEVLELQSLSVEDDFFELGGDSLKAVCVLSRIRHRLGAGAEFADLFAHPTVAGLSAAIDRRGLAQDLVIPAAEPQPSYPLSNAQARIWVLSRMEGGAAAYNMPMALQLEGDLEERALEQAFRSVIARHESLRTCFVTDRGLPRQKILPAGEVSFELPGEDLTGTPSAEDRARERIQEEFARPFDFASAPLLRARLFRMSEHRWVLSLVVSHIVADGWSLHVLLRELAAFYAGGPRNPLSDLPALPIQYRDYSQWLAERSAKDAFAADRAYWKEKLAEPLPALQLPADAPRPATLGFTGAVERFSLPRTAGLNIPQACAEHGVSPFLLLLSGVFGLLHRYTGEEDLIVGTPVANRDRMELENQIGLYLNTLAVRVRVDPEIRLRELLRRIRQAMLEAQEHRGYPFDSLIRDLNVKRSTDRNPLFDVMAVMQDVAAEEFRVPRVCSSEYPVPLEVSVFDLTFHFHLTQGRVRFDLEYNTGLFGRPRMERLAGHLDRMVEAIATDPDARLQDVDLMGERERRQVLVEFAEGPSRPVPEWTVIDRFLEQAAQKPDRTAVVFESRSLSYRALSSAAARLAGRIRRADIAPGSVVALLAARSEWMVPGVIGIMASGMICLPIDPALPEARIRRMLEDSLCRAVIADGALPGAMRVPVFALRQEEDFPAPFRSAARPADGAYLTYTSGSTGEPKGTVIEHRSLANLVGALGELYYRMLPDPAAELLLTSIGFDVALKQIFGALTRGNTLVVAPDSLRYDPAALMAAIPEGGIHLIDLTPSHFEVLLARGFARMAKPSLRVILLGSESLPSRLAEEFLQHEMNRSVALFNFYGPSECTVETLCCRLKEGMPGGSRIAPIGRPIANARAYVLSAAGRPAPVGIPGEIWLGGVPVGRGYWSRPELSAARFLENPFHPGDRIYGTGDLGRWSSDGLLEFLGRKDDQVKIRGFRVEPGEIEFHLRQHPAVSGAVVEGRRGPAGSMELVAWYTADPSLPGPDALRTHLARTLPDYMIPARLVALRELPMLPSGKLDLRALPDPWTRPDPSAVPFPCHEVEDAIRAMWRNALGFEEVAADAGFFDIGGNSLLLAHLHAQMDDRWPGVVKVTELFSAVTVADQARLVSGRTSPPVAVPPPSAPDSRPGPADGTPDRSMAIIGIGLRIGSCRTLDELWAELFRGTDFVGPLTDSRRRRAERAADALGMDLSALRIPELAYLDSVDTFDYAHFRIAPQKAAQIDPREKLFLETAWHAIEDAGYGGLRLKGTRTGVFLGESGGTADFGRILEAAGIGDPNQLLESLTPSIAASRISYLLDLRGPAMLVDTACSGSLAALSLAVESLRSGQCEMALVGTVKLHLLPFRREGRSDIESPDARTRCYDDEAGGTGGGEACIALLLKPLVAARSDGDPIHAVLRGAAMNQDGSSSGITAPRAEAQAEVIELAWKDAGIHPENLSFIEGHGTGTRLGDPVEVQGLSQAFDRYTSRRQFCALGSIKSNLGHTDHAAGLTGLLRAVLCLRHRCVAPVVHFQRPNRNIRLEDSPLFVNAEPLALDGKPAPLLCGVSSFGLSGTNVHVVLEEALPGSPPPGGCGDRMWLIPLSARTPDLLREQAANLGRFLERSPDLPLNEIAFTLSTGRDHLGARAALLVKSVAELGERLNRWNLSTERPPAEGVFLGFHKPAANTKPVLLDHEIYEETIERLSAAAAALAGTDDRRLLAEVARLYVSGAGVPWEKMFADPKPRRCFLPGYPFERTVSWPEMPKPAFSLLGNLKAETSYLLIFESSWRTDSHWLLEEHRRSGVSILVGAAYLEIAQEAALRLWNTGRLEIRRLILHAPLAVEEGESVRVAVSVKREKENLALTVESHSLPRGWQTHATAELARLSPDHQDSVDLAGLRKQCLEEVSAEARHFAPVEAGPHWNCLQAVRRSPDWWMAELEIPVEHALHSNEFGLYPPMADLALNFATGQGEWLPLWFSGIRIHGALPRQAVACGRRLDSTAELPRYTVAVADLSGRTVFTVDEYLLKAGRRSDPRDSFFHQAAWTPTQPGLPRLDGKEALLIEKEEAAGRLQAYGLTPRWPSVATERLSDWQEWLADREPGTECHIALRLPSSPAGREESLEEPDASMGLLFSLTQGLIRWGGKARLLVLGGFAHQVTGEESMLRPLHAAAAGFCRVIEQETSHLRVRFLDLDTEYRHEQILGAFHSAFAFPDPVAAWRSGTRYVPRIAPLDLSSCADRVFGIREGGTYLISGGTGGMGLALARHLAGQAKVDLVLVARSPFPEPALWEHWQANAPDPWLRNNIRTMREIQSLGSAIHLVSADVACREDMERLAREFPSIRAVFHCAGVGNDVFLARHDWERLLGVLRPKVQGTAVLAEVFGGKDLDALVLAGSITAFTGAPGQAGYTAANAFQDAEARRLRARGLPALAVCWTAWKETGMAARSGKVADEDYRAITTADALHCLDLALRKELGHLVIGEAVPPKESLPSAPAERSSMEAAGAGVTLRGRITGEYSATEQIVGGLWAKVLGYTDLDIFADFYELGGDSIAAIDLLERFRAETGFRPSLPDLLGHLSVESLASFLDGQQFLARRSTEDFHEQLVRLGGGGPHKLFCFAPGSGSCYRYYPMASRLNGWEIYGLNFFDTDSPAADLAEILVRNQPSGPFTLLGYSIGGNLAYEVAHELIARGRRISGLLFLDNWRRLELFHFSDEEYRKNAEEFLSAVDPRYLALTDRSAAIRRVVRYDRYMDSRQEDRLLPCPIRLIQAEPGELKSSFRITQEGWGDLTSDFSIVPGSGRHLEMLDEPHVIRNTALVQQIIDGFKAAASVQDS